MAKVRKAKYIYKDGTYFEVGGGGSGDSPADLSDLILVQDDEPTTPDNKIWIKETATPVVIPDMDDIADFVSFSEDQTSRTGAEKARARANINAEKPWVKVWENASPTSNFAAQDVPLDLTDASEIAVLFKSDTSSSAFIDLRYVLSAEADTADGQKALMSIIGLKVQQRYDCAIKRDKIHFGKGCLFNSYGTRSDGNQYAIPWYIYAR